MNDTNVKIEIRFNEMMMKKSGQERMEMGFSMFNMVHCQVLAAIKMDKPDADEREIRKEMFLRFYGPEFTLEEQKKILMRLL